ncbi:MAG: chromosomal replication initiator protein DnaA, partial [Prolixibacteraceae bacterium]|nr:chromosomal replication initiator protein DnaA [Prolixibacteraceae bacterium]
MSNKHSAAWEKCLNVIKDNVPGSSYKTWFEPIEAVKLEDKGLTIQVPSAFFYEY